MPTVLEARNILPPRNISRWICWLATPLVVPVLISSEKNKESCVLQQLEYYQVSSSLRMALAVFVHKKSGEITLLLTNKKTAKDILVSHHGQMKSRIDWWGPQHSQLRAELPDDQPKAPFVLVLDCLNFAESHLIFVVLLVHARDSWHCLCRPSSLLALSFLLASQGTPHTFSFTWLNTAATITLVSKIGAATILNWPPLDAWKRCCNA